jgi:dTDP-glucose 4,6-dehydratase
MARAYHITYGLDVVVTRCSNNFGPYQHPEKAMPLMITNWLEGRPFPLYGDGRNVRDWIHVLDHVTALELVLECGKAGEVYNIGGSRSLENRELVARVRRIMGVGPELVAVVPDRLGHDRRYAIDCAKLRRLGFRHAFSFDEALRRTVEWYRTHESWWKAVKGEKGFRQYYKRQYKTLH